MQNQSESCRCVAQPRNLLMSLLCIFAEIWAAEEGVSAKRGRGELGRERKQRASREGIISTSHPCCGVRSQINGD